MKSQNPITDALVEAMKSRTTAKDYYMLCCELEQSHARLLNALKSLPNDGNDNQSRLKCSIELAEKLCASAESANDTLCRGSGLFDAPPPIGAGVQSSALALMAVRGEVGPTYDTEHRDNIVCPHCGYEERDSWEVDFGPGLEGETEHQCARCCETMKAERCCTMTYTTAKSPNEMLTDAPEETSC